MDSAAGIALEKDITDIGLDEPSHITSHRNLTSNNPPTYVKKYFDCKVAIALKQKLDYCDTVVGDRQEWRYFTTTLHLVVL